MITRYHAKYYAHLLTQKAVGGELTSLSQSLLSSSVDINPHQIDAALFAFRSPLSKGVVLADEVGLGKTIEAGLVVCQYWAMGRRKIIIVCPASLRKQWEAELLDKFGLASEILDTHNYRDYRRRGQDPFAPTRVIICSYHFAARYKGEILLADFDLAVVDEAHKLRNVYRANARTAMAVRDALHGTKKLLLTATPFQNSLMELYGLTSIIDDGLFGSEKSFRSQYGKGENLDSLRRRIEGIYTRTLRRDVREYINYTHRLPLTQKFNATDAEQELYNRVSDFLRRDNLYSVPAAQKKLTTMVVRKILASSICALIHTLGHIRDRLCRMLEEERISTIDLGEMTEDIDDYEGWMAAERGDWEYDDPDTPTPVDEDEEIDVPSLKAEIATIEGFIQQAKNVSDESKPRALLSALSEAFGQLEQQGARRKALIFTESTKTQAYLREYLEANGYAGRVVLFNGKVSEPQTNAIYQAWTAAHPDKVSGIKAADRRAAIVDHFSREADIMIATEAAGEGLNLQFCSLVINYDLPWNPQRIEQRIGRCHRYGQKHDVVVVNFLNLRNYADVRVFELLSNKFKLFDDVFGASDEVLGQADTIDLESRILAIYQECRTEEEIKVAFDALQAEMQEQIDERMEQVRGQVLEQFSIDVQEHLRLRKEGTGAFLNRYYHIFWELTRHVLSPYAVFDDTTHTFLLRTPVAGCRTGRYCLLGHEGEGTTYRLSHPLAAHVVNTALSYDLSHPAAICFDESALRINASLPEHLQGESGWLLLQQLSVASVGEEQHTLFSAFTDAGRVLTQEECERLFLNGGTETPFDALPAAVSQRLQADAAQHAKATLQTIDSKNLTFINAERQRINRWEEDMIGALEEELKQLRAKILQAERESAAATSVQAKLEAEKKVAELMRRRRRLRADLEDREDEIAAQCRKMIDDLEARLIQATESRNLFVIRWKTKNND